MGTAGVQSDLILSFCGQLLKDKVGKTLEDVADSVCSEIGDEMLRALKRFKASFVERSPRRGGNPVFVRLIRQVCLSQCSTFTLLLIRVRFVLCISYVECSCRLTRAVLICLPSAASCNARF